jgi:hypothetical protein
VKTLDVPNILYPVIVVQDRYSGVYSGGRWLAIANGRDAGNRMADVWCGAHGGDTEAAEFGADIPSLHWIAVGETPDEAVAALVAKSSRRIKGTEPV